MHVFLSPLVWFNLWGNIDRLLPQAILNVTGTANSLTPLAEFPQVSILSSPLDDILKELAGKVGYRIHVCMHWILGVVKYYRTEAAELQRWSFQSKTQFQEKQPDLKTAKVYKSKQYHA